MARWNPLVYNGKEFFRIKEHLFSTEGIVDGNQH